MNTRALILTFIAVISLFLWSCGSETDDPTTGTDAGNDVALANIPTLSDRASTITPAPADTPAPTSTADPNAIATEEAAAAAESGEGDTPGAADGDAVAIERGKTLAQQCMGCHSVDGSQLVGPTWQGLYGRSVTLSDGSSVTADDAYITRSITDPGSQIVEGFPPSMPPFTTFSDQDLADIIAYIQSLAN